MAPKASSSGFQNVNERRVLTSSPSDSDAISRWGEEASGNNAVAEANAEAEPTEPLAELGVAPGESSASNDSDNKQ